MKNIFNLSVILLLAVFVTACNQNEELDNTPMKAGNELNVTVTAGDFQAADAGTRATETGYQTTFVEGDKIGVYVIAKDGKTLLKTLLLQGCRILYCLLSLYRKSHDAKYQFGRGHCVLFHFKAK